MFKIANTLLYHDSEREGENAPFLVNRHTGLEQQPGSVADFYLADGRDSVVDTSAAVGLLF